MTLLYSFKICKSEVKATWTAALELLLLSLCLLLPEQSDAHILVYRRTTSQLIEEFNDLPAQFGPSLPVNGLKGFVQVAVPIKACDAIQKPDSHNYPNNAKFIAIIERDNCTFALKVRNAQTALFDAVVVYNNKGDDLETMSANDNEKHGIRIPSVFVGHNAGLTLRSFQTDDVVIVINDELPFNINTQLILPFSILIGLCFLIMIFYMIYKCIREERRLRRYRLPKSMLKKLPVLKYSKSSDIVQETCVICIEDFFEGDKLRMLPCRHVYHTHCIDPWLTENRRVCPICKRKVFTKGEARANRNRHSSLDSVTDTDDDTTPLLQPAATNNNNSSSDGGGGGSRRNGGGARNSRNATTITTTTQHGTFRDDDNSVVSDTPTSDEENLLLTQQQSPMHNARRINPFDRRPNLPAHLAEQLNESSQRSIWSYPIFRLFRRQQPISIVAPPFPEEISQGNRQRVTNVFAVARGELPPLSNVTAAAAAAAAAATPPAILPASNNILNPNLSGSFKDDDEIPHQSIYEPIAPAAVAVAHDGDSVFIQTPVQGGIGVVALPNTAFTSEQNGAGAGDNGGGGGGVSARGNDPRFLV